MHNLLGLYLCADESESLQCEKQNERFCLSDAILKDMASQENQGNDSSIHRPLTKSETEPSLEVRCVKMVSSLSPVFVVRLLQNC